MQTKTFSWSRKRNGEPRNADLPPASLEIAESAEVKGKRFATDENQMDTDNSRQNPLHFICVHRSSSVANVHFSAASAISSEAGGK
jgi:hypothetical protein